VRGLIAGVAIALSLPFALCGCAPSTGTNVVSPGGPGGGDATAVPGLPQVTPADVTFATAMLAHHKQGVELAQDALVNVTDPTVRAVAERSVESQMAEQKMMQTWLDGVAPELKASHNHSSMTGMLGPADIEHFTTLKGADARAEFLRLMILHHQGAIDMANERLKVAGSGTITELARSVAVEQSVEVDRMRELADPK
jgi:uncharacterized protein (DUF305 family)